LRLLTTVKPLAWQGRYDSFKFWEKSGTWNLLSWTIETNNPEAVRLLVAAGANKSQAMLKLAISKGYSEIISILMAN